MLILLPPSETKAAGGATPALDLETLLWPQLRHPRCLLIDDLAALARDLPAARGALGVSAAKDDEVAANAALRGAPTLPALDRYTGVLFHALDVRSMTRAERSRAEARIVIASALFGAVRGGDRIPGYRLSAGSTLPGRGTLAALWKPLLTPLLAAVGEPVLDLRSGSYAALGAAPGAVTARVVTVRPDGSRQVVSHFNKATKGLLARLVAIGRGEPSTAGDVARLASRSGLRVRRTGPTELEIET